MTANWFSFKCLPEPQRLAARPADSVAKLLLLPQFNILRWLLYQKREYHKIPSVGFLLQVYFDELGEEIYVILVTMKFNNNNPIGQLVGLVSCQDTVSNMATTRNSLCSVLWWSHLLFWPQTESSQPTQAAVILQTLIVHCSVVIVQCILYPLQGTMYTDEVVV